MKIKGFCIKINKSDYTYATSTNHYTDGTYAEIKYSNLAFNFSFLASEYKIDSFNGINYMFIYSNSIDDLQDLINYIEDVYEKKLTYTFIDEECE